MVDDQSTYHYIHFSKKIKTLFFLSNVAVVICFMSTVFSDQLFNLLEHRAVDRIEAKREPQHGSVRL